MAKSSSTPAEGDIAPDFNLPATGLDEGATLSLKDFSGKALVLFFYPKDDTSGCTKEAIGFTEAKQQFEALGVSLLGVSPDPVKKHIKFQDKHNLEVQLMADEEKTALEAYGVWVEKSMYGKKYMGVERSTFLIDGNGKILKVWRKVKVGGHVEAVLEAARELV